MGSVVRLTVLITITLILILILLLVVLRILRLRVQQQQQQCSSSTNNRNNKVVHQQQRLPPGTMGWPYIGETFQLYSQNPNVFFASKEKKYGSIYKSHILGCPCVMISSPTAAKDVLVNRAHLFKPSFPASKERMIGKRAIFFHQGDYHLRLRKLVLRAFSPESLVNNNFVTNIDSIASQTLCQLLAQSQPDNSNSKIINTFQEMKNYTFSVALMSIFGNKKQQDEDLFNRDVLKRCYYTLEQGYNSMPLFNIPGTLFHKSMKARKELATIVARNISARRTKTKQKQQQQSIHNITDHHHHHHFDLLASFMTDSDALTLTDQQIADNVIGVIFAARDTTATVLTWVIKYLADNPSILQAVVEEQESILKAKEGIEMSWADTKKMRLTSMVIQETMRLASILSFTFREAVQDLEIDGYFIPKGWKVLPLFRNIHHSPNHFDNPLNFDPYRFQVAPKPNTFLPFGNGIHSCPGNELAKLEMLILIHHLTTKYRWTIVGPQNRIQYGPFALPQDGLPIQLFPKNL